MKKLIVLFLSIVLVLTLSLPFAYADGVSVSAKEHSAYKIMVDFVNQNPYRKTASEGAEEAAEYIDKFFENKGLEHEIQNFEYNAIVSDNFYYNTVEKRADQNVIGRVKTTQDTSDTVVIGAHYDNSFSSGTGRGVYDNGSGVGIMLALAEMIQKNKEEGKVLPFNVEFVAFGAQEYAMRGSEYYLESLRGSQINSILLYVNLDSISAGDHLYVYADEFKSIQEDYFVNIAIDNGITLSRPPANKGVFYAGLSEYGYAHIGLSSDNVNFLNRDVLSLSFSSHNWSTFNLGVPVEGAGKPNVRGTANDNVEDIEKLYGEGAWQKMVDVYDIVYTALYRENFATDMRMAKMDNPDYSLLTSRFFIPGICAGFLAIVTAIVLSYAKKHSSKKDPDEDGRGENGGERARVFSDFD